MSYLQCVCVVERVKPDPEHIRFMLQENNGDVRRSLLELELWARSGAGSTHHHLHNRALTVRVINTNTHMFTPFYTQIYTCVCVCVFSLWVVIV